jgi:phosphoribosyl-dephospho-CoA transferase
MDLIDTNNNRITRKYLKLPHRSCFLCNQYAKICAIKKKHKLNELLFFIKKKMKKFLYQK